MPLKPARAAASKRSRNSCSPKSIDRLAEKRGMLPPDSACVIPHDGNDFRLGSYPSSNVAMRPSQGRTASVEQLDRGRRILVVLGKLLDFDDIIDLGAHRDVGDPLEDEFDDD